MSQLPVGRPRIRFAVVGCGRIATNHFGALREHARDAELVAVCDSDPAALGKAVEATGARGYLRLAELLESAAPDVVVLSTPSGLHSQQAIQAARHGIHVVTEKPMATRWLDGLSMVRACDEAGVKLFVVKQNRGNATLRLVKRAIEQGR